MFETLKQLLGMGADAAATRDADPDDLFGMSTAYLTMDADLGFEPASEAALCFSGVESTAFQETLEDVEAILETGEEEGTLARVREDEYGYHWVVVEATDPENLVTSIHFAANTLVESRFGSRLLAAVFGFEATDRASAETGRSVYWVYSFRRGAYYPFVPTDTQERDQTLEFSLESVLDGELTVEPDREYWYPLWPDSPDGRPWN
jgi:hypothetical protein